MFWSLVYWFVGIGQEWYPHDPAQFVDVKAATVQALIAKAEATDDRQCSSRVEWTYSRDRIVERRELRIESEYQRAARIRRSAFDKAREAARKMRMVV